MSNYFKRNENMGKIVKYVMRTLSVGFVVCMVLGTAIFSKDVQAKGEDKPLAADAKLAEADLKLGENQAKEAEKEMGTWGYLSPDKKEEYLNSLKGKSAEEVKKRFEEIKKEYKSFLLEKGRGIISEFDSIVKELASYDELENTEDYEGQIRIWTGDGKDNPGGKDQGPKFIKAYEEYVKSADATIKGIEDKILSNLEYYRTHADIELKTRQIAQWRKKYPENPIIEEKFNSNIKQKDDNTYASQIGSNLAGYYNDEFLKAFHEIEEEVKLQDAKTALKAAIEKAKEFTKTDEHNKAASDLKDRLKAAVEDAEAKLNKEGLKEKDLIDAKESIDKSLSSFPTGESAPEAEEEIPAMKLTPAKKEELTPAMKITPAKKEELTPAMKLTPAKKEELTPAMKLTPAKKEELTAAMKLAPAKKKVFMPEKKTGTVETKSIKSFVESKNPKTGDMGILAPLFTSLTAMGALVLSKKKND